MMKVLLLLALVLVSTPSEATHCSSYTVTLGNLKSSPAYAKMTRTLKKAMTTHVQLVVYIRSVDDHEGISSDAFWGFSIQTAAEEVDVKPDGLTFNPDGSRYFKLIGSPRNLLKVIEREDIYWAGLVIPGRRHPVP